MQQVFFQEKRDEKHPLLENRGSGPDGAHPYHRKMLGCPCPAISAMINHSYLKVEDSSQKIPVHKLMIALVECYNLSWTFAIVFAIVGTLRLGKLFGFSIQELGEHGKIEHDASMTRFDADKGNALDPSPELIDQLFQSLGSGVDSKNKVVTLEDFAKKKLELESRLTKFENQSKDHINLLGRGEVCLALQANLCLRSGSESPKAGTASSDEGIAAKTDWMRTWFTEERLPVEQGWKKPVAKITLLGTLALMREMKAHQEKLSRKKGASMFS
ncbi:hypothetical protein PGT21_030233 [Puccinia graminis f. sp. tritici]|uniref:Heme haloperoxidase family profile domain-containing protein n=1 Tax=Puccinia graminis f. sp. tritici TaxID=56615 RepID=A0A5B0MYU1_PUCGR|nr:hypothetical protein PGT21_030233 [Puccinia graminis f. sp. tritici]KAA1131299.1 hypothetical protein PGTUg99_030617 [Puccinia graminis f. sp. tritici]